MRCFTGRRLLGVGRICAHNVGMRCFLAIALPPELRRILQASAAAMRALSGDSMRVVAADNLHLTLKFMEDLRPDSEEELAVELQRELASLSPFETAQRGYGAFPNSGRARVFWAGLEDSDGHLQTLARITERAAERVGVPREKRRFEPHITLGRFKRPAHLPLDAFVEQVDTSQRYPLAVRELTLFESRTYPEGPVYTALESFVLGGTGERG